MSTASIDNPWVGGGVGDGEGGTVGDGDGDGLGDGGGGVGDGDGDGVELHSSLKFDGMAESGLPMTWPVGSIIKTVGVYEIDTPNFAATPSKPSGLEYERFAVGPSGNWLIQPLRSSTTITWLQRPELKIS